jgi:hypothetical protein
MPALQDRVDVTIEAKPDKLVTIREIEPILVGTATVYDPFEGHFLICEVGGIDEVSFLEVDVSSSPATATLRTTRITCDTKEACSIKIDGGQSEAIDVIASRGLRSEDSPPEAVLTRLYKWDVEFLVFSGGVTRRFGIADELGKPHLQFVAVSDLALGAIDRVCWSGQRWYEARDGEPC